PPGGKGTTNLIGPLGQSLWALAMAGAPRLAARLPASTARRRNTDIFCLPDTSSYAPSLSDFLVARETDRVGILRQQGCQDHVLPELPFLRIIRGGTRRLRRAPQLLPGLTALEDPDRRIGAAPRALQPFDEMMRGKAGEIEQTAPLGVAERPLEVGVADAGLQLVLVDADDLAH